MSKGPSKSGFNPSKEKFSQSYLRKEQAKTKRLVTNDLNKSATMETIEKSLVFQHHFGKILLSKVYNCVLSEKST